MSPVSLLLNIFWIAIGGLWMAVGWLVASVIMALTIFGLPWARAAFNIAIYTLLPFGQKAVSRAEYGGRDLGTAGCWDLSAISSGACSRAGGWRSLISSRHCSSPSPSSAFRLPGRI
jgi:Inner membrane component domain